MASVSSLASAASALPLRRSVTSAASLSTASSRRRAPSSSASASSPLPASSFRGTRLVAETARMAKARGFLGFAVEAKVKVGDKAPDFRLKDESGRDVSLSKFKGKDVVLYFYPADDTPGCTKQACSFRDAYSEFTGKGAVVVGVSGDSPASHKAFKAKYNLPYTLLSDEGNEVRKAWGIPSDLFGALAGRQTYVIDRTGTVKLIFNNQFQPTKHIDETLKVLAAA
eukprot:jgi/Chlat1/6173/Chrsp41S05716